jgi:hypothetical protein
LDKTVSISLIFFSRHSGHHALHTRRVLRRRRA